MGVDCGYLATPQSRRLIIAHNIFHVRFRCCSRVPGFVPVGCPIRGVHHEHLRVPKASAFSHARSTPPLVGSKEAPHAARAHQRGLRAAERDARIHLCEGRLAIFAGVIGARQASAPLIFRVVRPAMPGFLTGHRRLRRAASAPRAGAFRPICNQTLPENARRFRAAPVKVTVRRFVHAIAARCGARTGFHGVVFRFET